MNLDRFSQGMPDPQEAKVMAYCKGCVKEIYEGEDVYVVDGNVLHAETDCLVMYINPEHTTIEEALGLRL